MLQDPPDEAEYLVEAHDEALPCPYLELAESNEVAFGRGPEASTPAPSSDWALLLQESLDEPVHAAPTEGPTIEGAPDVQESSTNRQSGGGSHVPSNRGRPPPH